MPKQTSPLSMEMSVNTTFSRKSRNHSPEILLGESLFHPINLSIPGKTTDPSHQHLFFSSADIRTPYAPLHQTLGSFITSVPHVGEANSPMLLLSRKQESLRPHLHPMCLPMQIHEPSASYQFLGKTCHCYAEI